MDLEVISFAFLVVGELLVATTALLVHENVQAYRNISKKKRNLLERERLYGWLGATCILVGGTAHIFLKLME